MKKTKLFLASLVTFITFSIPTTTYAWGGNKDGTGTHANIANQAVEILNNDLNESEPQKVKDNLNILNKYIDDLKLGSTFPDYDPNAYDLYQDHFWDPDTGYNFTHSAPWYTGYTINETADTQVRKFTALAINDWKKGNYKAAEFELGQALHYLGDLTCPYHAANITAVDSTGHTKYENYADKNIEKYLIATMNSTTESAVSFKNITSEPLSTWTTKNNKYWSKIAKNLYFKTSKMSDSWEDWDYSLRQALPNSQKCTALWLYRFINEVSGTVSSSSSKFNQLQVVIKTEDLSYAGTEDYVYFGLQTKDGQKFELSLNNPGNDFEKNQTDNYNLKLPQTIDYKTITNTWIRKAEFGAGDDWKPTNVKVIINGYVKQDVGVDSWLSGNTTYNMPVSIK